MATSQVLNEFLERLETSRLLPSETLEEAAARLDLRELSSPKDAARLLVKEKLLTAFQANRLLDGHWRGFFVGEFKLLEILGDGGMGRVYVAEKQTAENQQAGQKVALKVLAEKCKGDAGILARMQLEARVGMRLNHPHIVKTYRLGHTGDVFDVHYIVMELFEAITLQELIALHGPVPWPQACDIMLQSAEGLHHAHESGLVHRDVKPANLLINQQGHVKILDFGLALSQHEEEHEFSLAMIFGHDCLGSADYMPPEQSLDSMAVDRRADLYSLGCTFYGALTGRLPFAGRTNAETIAGHRSRRPRPIRERAPDVPEAVERIVLRMMGKRPEDRFATAAEVARVLQPLARRKAVPFSFRSILSMRAALARQRAKADEERSAKAQSTQAMNVADTNPQSPLGNSSSLKCVTGTEGNSSTASIAGDLLETFRPSSAIGARAESSVSGGFPTEADATQSIPVKSTAEAAAAVV
ncbi:MAG: serine/threonine protein kinase, partial [Planctomycetaceae bacterium]